MEVAVNDWRGRNPQHVIDAMIHHPNCPQSIRYWDERHWSLYPSREAAEADIGELAFTCQKCLPGHGRVLDR